MLNAFLSHWACKLESGKYCQLGRDGRPFQAGRGSFDGSDGEWAVSGHSGESAEQTKFLFEVAARISPRQICEVGFNAGHSALTLLVGSGENSSYLGFDWSKLNPGLNEELFRMIRSWFPRRDMKILWGDAYPNIQAFLTAEAGTGEGLCDLIFFDGPHDVLQVLKFMPLLRSLARRSRPFLLVDDVECSSPICLHSTLAWHFLVWMGIVISIDCRATGTKRGSKDMGACLGRFQWGQAVRCQAFDARCVAHTLGMSYQQQQERWHQCCLTLAAATPAMRPDAFLVQL